MTADDTVTAKLAEWEALTEGATDGPWEVVGDGDPYLRRGDVATRGEPGDRFIVCENAGPDAEFIAAARTAMPALLAAVKGVLRVCDERRGDCGDDYADGWTQGWRGLQARWVLERWPPPVGAAVKRDPLRLVEVVAVVLAVALLLITWPCG